MSGSRATSSGAVMIVSMVRISMSTTADASADWCSIRLPAVGDDSPGKPRPKAVRTQQLEARRHEWTAMGCACPVRLFPRLGVGRRPMGRG